MNTETRGETGEPLAQYTAVDLNPIELEKVILDVSVL